VYTYKKIIAELNRQCCDETCNAVVLVADVSALDVTVTTKSSRNTMSAVTAELLRGVTDCTDTDMIRYDTIEEFNVDSKLSVISLI